MLEVRRQLHCMTFLSRLLAALLPVALILRLFFLPLPEFTCRVCPALALEFFSGCDHAGWRIWELCFNVNQHNQNRPCRSGMAVLAAGLCSLFERVVDVRIQFWRRSPGLLDRALSLNLPGFGFLTFPARAKRVFLRRLGRRAVFFAESGRVFLLLASLRKCCALRFWGFLHIPAKRSIPDPGQKPLENNAAKTLGFP
jgi:hypothetical protein